MILQSSWNDGVQTFIDLLNNTPPDDLPVEQVYPGGWSEYQDTWRAAGVQDNHIQRFTDAGIIIQPKQLEFLYWARQADFDDQPNEIGFGGARGGGKAQPLDSCVITPFGVKKMRDIKIGSQISNPDGSVAKVIQIHPQGIQDVYEITFIDGAKTKVTGNHLWLAWRSLRSLKADRRAVTLVNNQQVWEPIKGRIMTTLEMKAYLEQDQSRLKDKSHIIIPMCEPVEFTLPSITKWGEKYRIDPYLLGLLIGDGGLTHNISYSSADEFLVDQIRMRIQGIIKQDSKYGYVIQDRELKDSLIYYGLFRKRSEDKFVPPIYMTAPISIRLELLQGLMDTDGYIDKRGHCQFVSTSRQLALDVQWLIRSLGGKATLTEKQGRYKDADGNIIQCQQVYMLYIQSKNNGQFFKLPRKKDRYNKQYNGGVSELGRRIVSIEYIGKEECQCITVDHPNGLYITDDFIVTHNSVALFVQAAIDDCQRFPGLKVLYLRKIGKRAAEQMQDMVLKTLSRVPHVYTRDQIKFPNGSRIIIGHFKTENEAMSYLGIEYDVIIVEETTTLSLHAYKHIRLAARSSKGWRPRIYNSTNPMGVGHAWYKKRFIDPERLGEALALGRKFIFATVSDNVFVYHGYIKQLEDLVGAEKRAYLHGDWDIAAGAYFENWNYTRHVIEPFTAIDPGWTIWAAMDYGFNHPNVILLHTQDQDGNIYTFHEIAHRRRYPIEIAADYRAILELYKIEEKRVHPFVVGNDAFNETGQNKLSIARQYQQDANITLYRADTSPGSRILSAQHITQLLGNPDRDIPQRLWITKNCRQLIESLPYIQRDPNNLEAPLKVDIDEDGDGGDDYFDAFRYGLYKPKRSSMA